MNDSTPLSDLTVASSHKGKDPKSRALLISLVVLWLITLMVLVGVAWSAYFKQKDAAQTLAQQIAFACKSGDFGPGLTEANQEAMCSNAQKVIKNETPSRGIQGVQGPQGIQGVQGPQGVPGVQGSRGPKGDQGKRGLTGLQGVQGIPGLTGPKGDTGAQGDPGPQGPTGVVSVATAGCDGPIIHQIAMSYDATTQTLTITCN